MKRLLRIGYINIKGYNDFDLDEWDGIVVKYPEATIADLKAAGENANGYTVLDLRTKPELEKEGVFAGNNIHVPIQELQEAVSL